MFRPYHIYDLYKAHINIMFMIFCNIMETRSIRSFNAIPCQVPATIISGVFNLYRSICYSKCIIDILLIVSFIFSFYLTIVNFFSGKFIHNTPGGGVT